MDDPNQENIESSWVMINPIDIAEEATTLNCNEHLEEDDKVDKNQENTESDIESDGISIISESSHLHESNNEEESFINDEREKNYGDDAQKRSVNDVSTEHDTQKTNWTFVDSETRPPEMDSSNQFYLNCLQEPVQELSEHELGSVQSDLESDGISTISDCESLYDLTEDEKNLSQEILAQENCDNERLELASKLPPGIKKYCNGVLIGTILLATTSIFLGQYFSSAEQMEEELPIYKEEYKSELKENVADKINEKYEVPTALVYCQERHKADGVFIEHNVDKCLRQIQNRMKRKKEYKIKKEEIKNLEESLKIKQRYLEEKEQFLIKREYELLKAELKLKRRNFKKNKNYEKQHVEEFNKNADTKLNDFKPAKVQKESTVNEKHKGHSHKEKIKYDSSRKHGLKNLRKSKRYQAIYGENENVVYTWKHKRDNSQYNLNKSKKHKKTKNKSAEKFSRNENDNENKNKKVVENSHVSSSEENKSEKLKVKRGNTNYIILDNNDNHTSGYWVGRLYRGRNEMRKNNHGGDWYFDRASYRKDKRDKAKWYFDWMMDRELLRKRSYHRSLKLPDRYVFTL